LAGLDDACVVGAPSWHEGRLRWVGVQTVAPLDHTAEWVSVPVAAPSSAPTTAAAAAARPLAAEQTGAPLTVPPRACPPDMVVVGGGAYCIDRFEARLFDRGRPMSPDHPPVPGLTARMLQAWAENRWHEGGLVAHAVPLPPLGRAPTATPRFEARSVLGVQPSGFVSGYDAATACRAAGKRLCALEEWTRACRGERDTKFPYGADYRHGACNVFRASHPARALHGNPSVGHLDPRLNRVADEEGPMRRVTGTHADCASRWGDDAAYDMVGNLDEWTAEKGGAFAGGFFARASRQGCEAVVTAHPRRYTDYSLGVRCCRDAGP
ncbi:MAG: SUMF1/EgtB/PvdO family nonheme iron enzyme, partial [Myxococcota bacterium]